MPALPYEELARYVAKLPASRRKATLDEIDVDATTTWTLHTGRMKANREYRVPF